MDEVLEARSKYRSGAITLGEYLAILDRWLDNDNDDVVEGEPV